MRIQYGYDRHINLLSFIFDHNGYRFYDTLSLEQSLNVSLFFRSVHLGIAQIREQSVGLIKTWQLLECWKK